MPRKLNAEVRSQMRTEFYDQLRSQNSPFDLLDAIKTMRKITAMTQAEYARFCGVSPRTLIDFERGVGNPSLATIDALLKPFNLRLSVALKEQRQES